MTVPVIVAQQSAWSRIETGCSWIVATAQVEPLLRRALAKQPDQRLASAARKSGSATAPCSSLSSATIHEIRVSNAPPGA